MNFFQSIVAMQVAGGWKINITKEQENRLVVAVLYYDDTVGDDARKKLPPMLLKGTAAELDEGFFATITQPVQETAQLFTNMEQYLKQREQAKLQSQQAKDNTANTVKQKSEKDKKYDAAMKLVDELEAKAKYREAWVKVPDALLYPEHADTIRARKTTLAKKFAPDMFDTVEEPTATAVSIAEANNDDVDNDDLDNDNDDNDNVEIDETDFIEPENDYSC